ncbi:MAG: VanZ family protein [Chloroflexota bacterium]
MTRISRVALALLLVYLVVLAFLTLRPVGADVESNVRVNLRPFATIWPALRHGPGTFVFANLMGNLLAFVPLGILLPLAFRRLAWPLVIVAGLVLSSSIEVTQFLISNNLGHGYRAADIDDVIVNGAGTVVGLALFGIGALGANLVSRGRRRAPTTRAP